MKQRVIFGVLFGAILGVVCILGASLRMPGELSAIYLFSFWFNRLLMGLVIGLFPRLGSIKMSLIRGILLGAFVSFAFYSATEFLDYTGFAAGLVYGVLIEAALFTIAKKN